MLVVGIKRPSSLVARLIVTLIHVRFHNFVEIRFVDHSTRLGALGFLLEVFTEHVEVEFAILDLGAGLKSVPVTS